MNFKRILKWTIISLITLVVIGAIPFILGMNQTERIASPIVAKAEIEPIVLSGTGQQATQEFMLAEGLSVFKMTHSGRSNFIVELLDNTGRTVELLVNEIGVFDGTKAVGTDKAGNYLLDISADGRWTVKIEQPRPTTAPAVPREFSGKGQQVSEMFGIGEGLARFEMTHDGASNFIVELLDSNGDVVDLLVNEIGPFDGSKATRIRKTGIYLLDILADGNWTISVEGVEPKPAEVEAAEKAEREGKEEGGCFIATAAYGTTLAPEIDILRDFRNEVLLSNGLGEKFVSFYYENSPPAAEFISHHPILKALVRELGIKPLIKILEITESIWD